jgi:hypothetical protein
VKVEGKVKVENKVLRGNPARLPPATKPIIDGLRRGLECRNFPLFACNGP